MAIIINPNKYTFSVDDDIIIKYEGDKVSYAYLYGLDGVVNSVSSTDNIINFPKFSTKGIYNCYIGTYISDVWTKSNNFEIEIKDAVVEPSPDTPPAITKSMPKLYDKTGTKILGELSDILEGSFVEEERNGLFDYEFEYPNDYPLADLLVNENMVEVKPNDEQSPQKFRIYDTKKVMGNIILVFARHESFDLANDHVENIKLENASCEYALNTLFRSSHFSQAYKGYSDVVNAQNYAIDNSNVINAIAGKEGSIVDTYGTGVEILRNNKEFHVLNKRGHDNGVTIEYGKNLTGFELDVDLTDLETRCGGFAKYRLTNENKDSIENLQFYSNKTDYNVEARGYMFVGGIVGGRVVNKGDTVPIRVYGNNYSFKVRHLDPMMGSVGVPLNTDIEIVSDVASLKIWAVWIDQNSSTKWKALYIDDDVQSDVSPIEFTWDSFHFVLGSFKMDATKEGIKYISSGSILKNPKPSPVRPPSENKDDIVVYSDWIDSPFISNFAHPYISRDGRRDYSDKFKDGVIPTKEALNNLCRDEFKLNKRDIPKSNYKIEFIPLSKCAGYEEVQDKISLCDIVTIKDYRFNVDTKAKVIKYKYDPIKERYISMELGEPRTTLGDVIGGSGGTVGPPGKDGIDGKPGADGNIGDFPNSLPNSPILTATVKGMAGIDLSWTYEDKVYYSYELYASKAKDFKPNTFDLIHEGQTSSFLFQAKPNETWYFRVCAKNTYGDRTSFSPQVTVTTQKQDNFDEYFSSLAVHNLVAEIFSVNYMEAGIIKGHWIDAKNLSVTNGNGVRTVDVDSFGNITLRPSVFKMIIDGKEQDVITENRFTSTIKGINQTLTKIEGDYVSQNNLSSTVNGIEVEISKTGVAQLVPNGAMQAGQKFWYPWNSNLVYEVNPNTGTKTIHVSPSFSGKGAFGVQIPACDLQANKWYTVSFWVESNNVTELNYNFLMAGSIGYKRIDNVGFSTPNGILTRVKITFQAPYDRNTCIMVGYEGDNVQGKYFRISEACCYEGTRMYPYKPCPNEIYNAKTFFDMEGFGVRHDDGSEFKATPQELRFTDIQARKKMAIKKGVLYTYDVKTGDTLGMIGSNHLDSTYKGMTTNVSGSSHYYAIGRSDALTDDDNINMIPFFLMALQDLRNVLGQSYLSAGLHILNTQAVFHDILHCKRFVNTGGIYSPNSILSLGYTNEASQYVTAFQVDGGSLRLRGKMPLDMEGWQIYNASLGYSVINNSKNLKTEKVALGSVNIFDEIEVVTPTRRNSIGKLDISNVTNKEEILIDDDNVDMGKMVTLLFKEVKALKEEIRILKGGS